MAENLTQAKNTDDKQNSTFASMNLADLNIQTIACQSQTELSAWLKKAAREKMAIIPSLPAYIPSRFQPEQTRATITLLDQSKMSSVLEHSTEDKLIKVEAGIKIKSLNQLLNQTNEWWPCHASDNASLFDVINFGEGGTIEHGFGGPKHLVLGLDVLLADGEAIKTGGRVVKNVTGYDLGKLFVGSQASLAIVLAAYLRLFARPEKSCTLKIAASDQEKLFSLSRTLMGLGLPISSLEVIPVTLLQKLLSPESQNLHNSSSALLLVELHGHDKEIREVKGKIEEKVKEADGKPALEEMEEALSRKVLTSLAETEKATQRHKLEVSCPQSQMGKIVSFISQRIYGLHWQARPGRDRLKFFAEDLDALSETTKALKQWSQENMQPLVVASADHEFSLRVRTLPNQDAEAVAIKLALKSHFDAENILNPLICL